MIFHGVPLDCINQAAEHYHVPATLIVSLIKTEHGWNGAAVKNKNGTVDLGVTQINSTWLPTLKRYGITREHLQYDGCVNVQTAAWILAKGMAREAGWQGVANYHSATPIHNQRYRQKIKVTYSNIQHLLHGVYA